MIGPVIWLPAGPGGGFVPAILIPNAAAPGVIKPAIGFGAKQAPQAAVAKPLGAQRPIGFGAN